MGCRTRRACIGERDGRCVARNRSRQDVDAWGKEVEARAGVRTDPSIVRWIDRADDDGRL